MTEQTPQEWMIHLISNTHWDREWYFSFERFRWRLVQLMDRLLDLLEAQPDSQPFLMDGQFIPIQDYLEMRPEQRNRIAQLVQANRLQIGPWYTQPLETIASGEAMIRNLMLGIERSLEMGGVTRIGYMIDEFGHVRQLPQICHGFGVADVVIWRGVPQGMNSLFLWHGSDGAILNVFYSNSGYGEATALPEQIEDFFELVDWTPQHRAGLKNRIKALLDLRAPKAVTRHLLGLNGIDHAYAQENLAAVMAKAQDLVPGVRLLPSSLPAYIAAVKAEAASRGVTFQDHYGELLDSNEPVLKDIHSFRCEQKAANRQAELLLEQWAEPFACLAWLAGNRYPKAELWKAWEYVLQNHSHDSLGCSSVDEVYLQVMDRYAWAAGIATEARDESLHFLCQQLSPPMDEDTLQLVVFNPSSRARSEWAWATVDIPLALEIDTFCLLDGTQEVPYSIIAQENTFHVRFNPQRGHSTRTPVHQMQIGFYAQSVPSMGYKSYQIRAGQPAQKQYPPLSPAAGVLENDHLRVEIHPNGTYDILDKTTRAMFAGLGYFEDGGEAGDGYNYVCPEQDEIFTSQQSQAEIALLRDDGLLAEYQITLIMALPAALASSRDRRSAQHIANTITQRLTLSRHSQRLDVHVAIDNQARDHRLRVVFPTGIQSDVSWAAMPFDVVERPVALPDVREYPHETPRPTHPQHHFVDVNDGRIGLMVANRGIYEYEVMDNPERSIALTLLRCTDRLDSGSLGAVAEMKMPLGQEIGVRSFTYSLTPHAAGWENGVQQADAFAAPLAALLRRSLELEHLPGYRLPQVEPPLENEHSFVTLEPGSMVITALKKHQHTQAVVVRALNRSDTSTRARLRLDFPGRRFSEVWQAGLSEALQEQLPRGDGGWVTAEVPAWGLWTTVWMVESVARQSK